MRAVLQRAAALMRQAGSEAGTSLVELVIVLVVMSILAIHLAHMATGMKQRAVTVPRQIQLEERLRKTMDQLLEPLRMIGAHVPGPQPPGATPTPPGATPTPGPGPTSQFAILWAQPFDLMFNADIRAERNAVPPDTVLPVPEAVDESMPLTYYHAPSLHEPAPPGSPEKARAETYRLSLDSGDENGLITPDDVDGSLAPASVLKSQNPRDLALIEQCWYSLGDFTTLEAAPRVVLATGIRAWLTDSDRYPNLDGPPLLFTYWLDERVMLQDFNDDGDELDLLLFGDEDGDGGLDAAEAEQLRSTNSLGGIGRAVSEAGLTASGPDLRFNAWRTTTMAGITNQRLTRILNRSIVRITVLLRLESSSGEPLLASRHSTPARPYRYRDATASATVTLHDLVHAYPHTRKHY
jgi:hypothetical protein